MKTGFFNSFVKSIIVGLGFGIGLITTVVIGVTVSTTFSSGDALTAAAMNDLKDAIESIPAWVKGADSSDAVFMDGNVGIGTDSPGSTLEVDGNVKISGDITGGNFLKLWQGVSEPEPTTSTSRSTTSTAWTDTDLSITVTTGASKILLMFSGNVNCIGTAGYFVFSIDGTNVVNYIPDSGNLFETSFNTIDQHPISMHWAADVTAGEHTFKVRWKAQETEKPIYIWQGASFQVIELR